MNDALYRQLLFGLLLLIAAIFALTTIPAAPKNPDSFIQWLLNYDYGLIKRGLVGYVIQNFVYRSSHLISLSDMLYLTTGLSLLTWFLYVVLAVRVWQSKSVFFLAEKGPWLTVLLVVSILIASPVGIIYYISTSHNLEVVNLLCLALLANVLLCFPKKTVAIISLLSFSIISSLVHESSLLSTIPAAFTMYFLLYAERDDKRSIAIISGIYLFCIALVVIAGTNSHRVGHQVVHGVVQRVDSNFASAVQSKIDDRVEVLQFTLVDNVKKGLRSFTKIKHVTRAVFCLLVTAPALVFLSVLIFQRLKRQVAVVVVLVGLLPLSLTILADDIFRWLILAVVGLGVLNLSAVAGHFKCAGKGEAHPDQWGHATTIGLGLMALLAAVDLPYPYFMSNDGNPLFGILQELWACAKAAFL